MLSFLIILILAYGMYVGARRGLVLQLFFTLGYLVFFGIAYLVYKNIGKHLTLLVPYPSATANSNFAFFDAHLGLKLDTAFYAGFAFLAILFIGWLVVHFASIFVTHWTFYPMNYTVSVLGAVILAFITNYVGLFLILYLMALVPIDSLQSMLDQSWAAVSMVRYSPVLTNLITHWWIVAA